MNGRLVIAPNPAGQGLAVRLKDGQEVALATPAQFVGYRGGPDAE